MRCLPRAQVTRGACGPLAWDLCIRRCTVVRTSQLASRSCCQLLQSSQRYASSRSVGSDAQYFMEVQRVTKVDTFAKSRVMQYIKRLPIVASTWIGGPQGADSLLIGGALDATIGAPNAMTTYVSRVVIPLIHTPPTIPFAQWLQDAAVEGVDMLIATGVAQTSRADADVLAAMHAERLLDATGRCLYVVAVSQKRYVAQRIQEGRRAPMPGDPIVNVPLDDLPLPLSLERRGAHNSLREIVCQLPRRPQAAPSSTSSIRQPTSDTPTRPHRAPRDQHATSSWKSTSCEATAAASSAAGKDETEGGSYMLCNVNTNRVNDNPHILTSPALIDPQSVARISKRLFGAADMLERHVVTASEDANALSAMFTCTLHISRSQLQALGATLLTFENGGEQGEAVMGKGKASTRERALQLCAMHLELLLFRAGVPLFPDDPILQLSYNRAAENKGWLRSLRAPYSPPPLPLKELHPTYNEYQYRNQRAAALSNEEKFMRFHGEAFNHAKTIMPIDSLHAEFSIPGFRSISEAYKALEAFQRAVHMRALAFVVSTAGDFRASMMLYNFEVASRITLGLRADAGEDAREYHVDESALLAESSQSDTRRSSQVVLPVPAYGVGPTAEAARNLCTLHAIEEINAMNLPVHLFNRTMQAEYAVARRSLGLYTPSESDLGHIPPQSRVLHQAHRDGDITTHEKRERGGRDGGTFAVTMAYAPTPSFCHDERRGPQLIRHDELGVMLKLRTVDDFQPVDDSTLAAMTQLYALPLQRWLKQHDKSVTTALPYRSIVEDQGSSWRHRSTAWLRIPLKEGAHIIAIGRGTRLLEAERACVAHAAVLLTHLELDYQLQLTSLAATEAHTRFMRALGRSPSHQTSSRGRHAADSLTKEKLLQECPPIVLLSTHNLMKEHRALYSEMRSAAIRRWSRQ